KWLGSWWLICWRWTAPAARSRCRRGPPPPVQRRVSKPELVAHHGEKLFSLLRRPSKSGSQNGPRRQGFAAPRQNRARPCLLRAVLPDKLVQRAAPAGKQQRPVAWVGRTLSLLFCTLAGVR